jgi:hypothetical protein
MPDDNGCAIPSSNSMGYQVVNRIDENRVLIIIEPNGDMVQRIKTKVNKMQEDIDNLAPDQTYNPESQNAQSGKAVAEAIASVDGTYELIETITLTEDVTSITRNTEPNGNAYRFKDVHIYFNWTNGSTKGKSVTLEVHCGNKNFSAFRAYDYAYNGSKSFMQTVYNHGKRFFIFSDASTNVRAAHNYPAAIPTVTLTSDEPIDKITLTHAEAFKAETKITIWGVRA